MNQEVNIKQDEKGISITGKVIEVLPDTKFKVELPNGAIVLARTAGKMRKFRIRIILHDTVTVRISPTDIPNLAKKDFLVNARLEYRFKNDKKPATKPDIIPKPEAK